MNRRGDKYGRTGIRMHKDGRAKPYYGRIRFQGMQFQTRYYATADQAALAHELMEIALNLSVGIPKRYPKKCTVEGCSKGSAQADADRLNNISTGERYEVRWFIGQPRD